MQEYMICVFIDTGCLNEPTPTIMYVDTRRQGHVETNTKERHTHLCYRVIRACVV